MQILQRARLAVRAIDNFWERTLAVIGLDQFVSSRAWPDVCLQACGLLVLTDVAAAGRGHASNFVVDARYVGNIAGADWLDDEIELACGKHRQILHRCFDGADIESACGGDLAIEREHAGAEIDDGDDRSGGGVERALTTAA